MLVNMQKITTTFLNKQHSFIKMQTLDILNTRDKKKILKLLKEQYGFEGELNYAFFRGGKGKIFLLSKEFANFDEKKVKIASLGMYFAQTKNDTLRLSLEGTQLIGSECSKNIVDIPKEKQKEWMYGINIDHNETKEYTGYPIVRCGNDFMGCTSLKEKELINFIPKGRRIGTIN